MSSPDQARTPARWRKSSRSGNNNNCVEADLNGNGCVYVRDTKHRDGAELGFTGDEWRAFVEAVKLGEFDL